MLKILILTLFLAISSASFSQTVKIHPNNIIAKFIVKKWHKYDMAFTIGNNIYYSMDSKDLFSDTLLLNHELAHVFQYKKLGKAEFIKRYLFFSIIFGYKNNPFEKEAAKEALIY